VAPSRWQLGHCPWRGRNATVSAHHPPTTDALPNLRARRRRCIRILITLVPDAGTYMMHHRALTDIAIMNDATHKPAHPPLAEIEQRFWSMHERSRREAPNSEAERRSLLRSLQGVISDSSPKFLEAIAEDYGHRSSNETVMAEVLPALMMVRGAL